MPISLSVKPLLKARHLWLSFLFLLAPLFFYSQTLTGLWVGALHNDSSSVRKDQSFEIALTEYRGKVFGYSRSEFIVNDTLYYIVKRVKGTIEGDICEVKDDEIISYNFRGKLDKGIKVTSTFRRNQTDSTWQLDGSWKTNATKKYYSVTGKVNLAEEKDLTASKLFPHLEELNKADEMVFYKERNEPAPFVKVAKPERIQSEYTEKADILTKNEEKSLSVKKPELPQPAQPVVPEVAVQTVPETKTVPVLPADALPGKNPVATNNPAQETAVVKNEPVLTVVPDKKIAEPKPGDKLTAETNIPVVAAKTETPPIRTAAPANSANETANTNTANPKVAAVKPVPVTNPVVKTQPTAPPVTAPTVKPGPTQDEKAVAKTKPTATAPALTPVSNKTVISNPVETNLPKPRVIDPTALLVKKSVEDPIKKSTMIAGRKSEFSQEVYFKSDSLILTLYDNGEIDGDTVSVYLNGEVVMPSQGLKSSAIRKIIHMDDGLETFTLVMFAESLGKYPPNTGLLVIRDGNDVYNLRFSSDFQKSSGIVFRRKQ
ncbi:MAG TPA: hypothetical protein PLU11_07130 [Chitinophagaceae bacterium]|nr:hypothetical protein [Chitinophagaceae bacterium]